jgi:hypothetical protein
MPENAVSEMLPGSARALVYGNIPDADDEPDESVGAHESALADPSIRLDSKDIYASRYNANAEPRPTPILRKPDQSRPTHKEASASEGKNVSFAPTPNLVSSEGSTSSPSELDPAPGRQISGEKSKASETGGRISKNSDRTTGGSSR